MFEGMFAQQPCKPPPAVGASQGRVALVAHRSERNSPERAKRVFSFWFFFSFARKEEKKNIEAKCNYYLGYSGFNTQIGTPLFLLTKKAQKKKFPKRKAPKRLRAQAVAFEKAPQNFFRIGAVLTHRKH